jgi:hypothetical protein
MEGDNDGAMCENDGLAAVILAVSRPFHFADVKVILSMTLFADQAL